MVRSYEYMDFSGVNVRFKDDLQAFVNFLQKKTSRAVENQDKDVRELSIIKECFIFSSAYIAHHLQQIQNDL